MSEKAVHLQLLDMGQLVTYEEREIDERKNGNGPPEIKIYEEWSSHSRWRPRLDILRTSWTFRADDTKELQRAIFAVDDYQLTADRDISTDYLSDEHGREHLLSFQRYFADPATISLGGLVVATNSLSLLDPFTSTAVEREIFKAAKV